MRRKIISIVLLISAIPFWMYAAFNGTVLAIARRLPFPEGVLFVCIAMIIVQIYFATAVWPQTQYGTRRGDTVQRVRWVTNVGMDLVYDQGVVIREYMDKHLGMFAISELHLEIRMDDGRILRFPKGMFKLCGDGVLEYQP